MTQYKNKLPNIEATQWFKNGDHPLDDRETFIGSGGQPFLGEGKIVRYFRHPDISGESVCDVCHCTMHDHGFIDDGDRSAAVCPSDYVAMSTDGHYIPMSADDFERAYEPLS